MAAPPPTPRGAFIVFEGADRAGKSTQCAQLVEHLRGRGVEVEHWRFPDRTTAIGGMINAYLTSQADLDDAAVHLLFSANRWEKRCVRVRGRAGASPLAAPSQRPPGLAPPLTHLHPAPPPPPPTMPPRQTGRSCCASCGGG